MSDPELAPLRGLQWPELDHRTVRTHLEHLGWAMCGTGDWSYVHRSPSGRLLARVSPFEPAYMHFVELCRRCVGNRHVPRIEIASPLEGGGHLAVLEYLSTPSSRLVERFLWQWAHPDEADADLRALRHEVDVMDHWGQRNVPHWGSRIEMHESHVLLSADGDLKAIDLFFVEGDDLFNSLLVDPHGFGRRMPVNQRRYVLDLPYLRDDRPADYVRRLSAALNDATTES